MDKVKNNIENNLAIYLLIIAVIVIFCIITFIGNKAPSELADFDTTPFNVVDSKSALELFDDKQPQMLVIGSNKCSATKKFLDVMSISQAIGLYKINYLELTKEDRNSSTYKEFVNKLDYLYTYNEEEKELKEYMGSTPMLIVIKNKKVVYGSLGVINSEDLTNIADKYGVSYEES